MQPIKKINYKDPHPDVYDFIMSKCSGRTFDLSDVPWEKFKCAWCHASHENKRRKYCDEDCSTSISIFTNPQNNVSKFFHFENANFSCRECGLDYSDFISKKQKRWSDINMDRAKWMKDDGLVYPSQIMFNTGDILHVDHIIPIHKGGESIGIKNIQVICRGCHLHKTARERKAD